MVKNPADILWISEVDKEDIPLVGKIASQLGELSHFEIPVPQGFIVTTSNFNEFLNENNLANRIKEILTSVNPDVKSSILQACESIHKLIMHSSLPNHLLKKIYTSYQKLGNIFEENTVNISSSSPFDSRIKTFQKVKGDANIILKIKNLWALEFDSISILKNKTTSIADLSKFSIAVIVQENIDSPLSGIMQTEDPFSKEKIKITLKHDGNIHATFLLSKEKLEIISKYISPKTIHAHLIKEKDILGLAKIGVELQKHLYFPQEVRFSILNNKIYVIHTQPITHTVSVKVKTPDYPTFFSHLKHPHAFLKGISSFPGIATGPVKIFQNTNHMHKISPSEIIVVPKIDKSLFSKIKMAKAVVSENIYLSPYERMLYARYVGRPAILGVKNATKTLHTGNVVTVNGVNREIYKGGLN